MEDSTAVSRNSPPYDGQQTIYPDASQVWAIDFVPNLRVATFMKVLVFFANQAWGESKFVACPLFAGHLFYVATVSFPESYTQPHNILVDTWRRLSTLSISAFSELLCSDLVCVE